MKTFSKEALDIINTLNKYGKAYIVGGAVRDYLLGREFTDEDITTDIKDSDVIKIIGGTIVYPGTVNFYVHDRKFEITTFRRESIYSDARHPDSILYTNNILDDSQRRDFTINALYYDGKDIIDLQGGSNDLKKGIIRFIGDAEQRSQEDSLRLLRAIRFATTLNFQINKKSLEAIFKYEDNLKLLSDERILEEYKGIFNTLQFNAYHKYFSVFKAINPVALPQKGYLLYNALYHDNQLINKLDKHTKYIFNMISVYSTSKLTLNRLVELILKVNNKDDIVLIIKGLHKEYLLKKYKNIPLELKDIGISGEDLKNLNISNTDFKESFKIIIKALALDKISNNKKDILLYLEKKK